MPQEGSGRDRPQRDWLSPAAQPARQPDLRATRDDRVERDPAPRDQREDGPRRRDDDGKGRPPRAERREDESKKREGDDDEKQDAKKGEEKGKDKQDDKPKAKPLPWWPFVLAAIVVLGFVAVVLWMIFKPRPDVWTDDAYVTVHYATIAPRVSGQVVAVPVDDNQVVKAGQVLMRLDPRDYETAVASAEAAVARDTAQVGDVSANVSRQPAMIDQQQASVDEAKARLAFAEADARRYNNLAVTGAGSGQQRQQADTTLEQARAQVESAEAGLEAARRQLDVLKAQKQASEATVKADQAELERARLNLSYTTIVAPLDGMVGQRSVQVGNYVGPGATVMTVIPLDQVYIESNYREVDLLHVRSGQAATVHVDAYDIDLDATVDSVPPASGASFAPIQPNNATGNFTKIVQRLPVKIVVRPGQPLAKLLKVGFSVETTIHTGLEDVVGEQRASPDLVTRH